MSIKSRRAEDRITSLQFEMCAKFPCPEDGYELILLSDTEAQKKDCKGCCFSLSKNECIDLDFSLSSEYGFDGGCDNPNKVSGIFELKSKD